MSRIKPQIRGYKNSRYDYRIGVYQQKRSKLNYILPTMFVMVVAFAGFTGYSYFNKKAVVLNQDTNDKPAQQTSVSSLFKEQVYQVREDQSLANKIKKQIDGMPKSTEWSISVRDLNTGRMANINSDKTYDGGNIADLFLIPGLEKKISSDNWKYNLGGNTIHDCVVDMLENANPKCRKLITDYTGYSKIGGAIAESGFSSVKIDETNKQISASDTAEMLYRLQTSKILSDKGRRAVFDALYEQKQRSGVPSVCVSQTKCLVANIAEEKDNFKNDASIVTHNSNKYVIVIISQNTSWKQINQLSSFVDREMNP